MAFISRFIINRINRLISKFNASTEMVDNFEQDYPLDRMGDHHRFFL